MSMKLRETWSITRHKCSSLIVDTCIHPSDRPLSSAIVLWEEVVVSSSLSPSCFFPKEQVGELLERLQVNTIHCKVNYKDFLQESKVLAQLLLVMLSPLSISVDLSENLSLLD